MAILSATEKEALLERYSRKFAVSLLGYGTVQDYCDSCDHLPWLSSVQNDLKDLQRPWTVKAALSFLPVGSRLLEIGAGQPLVAAFLAELGYDVTVIDPYDGSGRGPTEFENFVHLYPDIRIIRDQFRLGVPQLKNEIFDGIYSISVLEHVPEPALGALFHAVSAHLRPGGQSFHSVDCVVQGSRAAYHFEQCWWIVGYQERLAAKSVTTRAAFAKILDRAREDVETCYLSPSGHNLWRGSLAYEQFPFRKVISVQTAVNACAAGGAAPVRCTQTSRPETMKVASPLRARLARYLRTRAEKHYFILRRTRRCEQSTHHTKDNERDVGET